MRDLVLGADDSVLREFTELDVVVVYERVSKNQTNHLNNVKPHSLYTCRNSESV